MPFNRVQEEYLIVDLDRNEIKGRTKKSGFKAQISVLKEVFSK